MKIIIKNVILGGLMLLAGSVSAQFPFYEAFDDNSKKWAFIDQQSADYVMSITGGHLYLESRNANAIQTFKYVGFDGKKDYELNAKFVFLGGDATDLNAVRWGMSDDGNKYYVFGYTDAGEYFVGKKDEKLKSFVNFVKTPYIKPKDYNLLQVKREGIWDIFKINGQEVYRAKNLAWFSDGLALKCPGNSRMKVDYVSFTDPVKDAALTANINNILFGGTTPAKPSKKVAVKEIPALVALPVTGSAEFKDFMSYFNDLEFPTKIHLREKKLKTVKDISQLAFAKQYYKVTDEYSVQAISKVANCADGYMLLIAHKQTTPQSENTEFFLHKFSPDGKSMGNVKIGRQEYMNKSYYYTTDFDFSRKDNIISIYIASYFHSDKKETKTMNFNQNFCTF